MWLKMEEAIFNFSNEPIQLLKGKLNGQVSSTNCDLLDYFLWEKSG